MTSLAWPIRLEDVPRVSGAALAVHLRGTQRYRLPELWCLHLYRYECELRLNGTAVRVLPRCVGVVPPGVELEYEFPDQATHLYVHFALPRHQRKAKLKVPALLDYGE